MGHDRKMGHVQSMGTYTGVFIGLLILTTVTVGVAVMAHSESELVNLSVAVGVATMKASLVVLFFMHGKYEDRVTWAFIWYPLVLLGLLLGGVFMDYMGRGEKTRPIIVAKSVYSADGHHGADHGSDAHGDHTHGADAGDHTHGADATHGDAAHGAEAPQGADAHGADAPQEGAQGEDTTTTDGGGNH